jgi:small subunit ribosomal protein S9
MSTDNPSSEDQTSAEENQTPEEALQAATPDAPETEPVLESEPVAPDESASDLPELTLGDGAPAEAEELVAPSVVRGKIDRFGVAMGTGRRKTSVARVRIKEGTGDFVVNGKPFDEFFCVERDRKMVQEVLEVTNTRRTVDVWVRVNGGGTTGQTGAVVLGVARALQVKDPSLHHLLATGGFLTRDDRMVERKKYGRRKARRSFQFSKR